jgi:hypothetical protein
MYHATNLTHQHVPTSSTIHLMYVPTHQLYTSCTQHVPQPYTKDIHQYNHQKLSKNSSLYP